MADDENERFGVEPAGSAPGDVGANDAQGDPSARVDGAPDPSPAPRTPIQRPLTPQSNSPRPLQPLRPPPPDPRVGSVVPAQAPKPSFVPTPRPKPERPAEPVLERKPEAHPLDAMASGGSNLDEVADDDDLVAVPAPSEEMLLSAAMRQATSARPAKRRSLTLQRTLIPILLTLAVLLPGFGVWLMLRPSESELRLYGQRLIVYLIVAGVVFLTLAIINMIQVRGALRSALQTAVR